MIKCIRLVWRAVYLTASEAFVILACSNCEAELSGLRPGSQSCEQDEVIVVESSQSDLGLSVLKDPQI